MVHETELPENIRTLTADDLERVIEIDADLTGRVRRGFFEKRLAAALAAPKDFVYLGWVDKTGLQGFLLARLSEGEFGDPVPVAMLDAMGVNPDRRGQGIGRRLMAGLEEILSCDGVAEIRSQVEWQNIEMIRFLYQANFDLAPRMVLERPAHEPVVV